MTSTGWIILVAANLPVYLGLIWVWFKDSEEFVQAILFWVKPDILSLFRGEYVDDRWAEIKLGFWAASCAACVVGEAQLIRYYFL
jgi:hypothetical protein